MNSKALRSILPAVPGDVKQIQLVLNSYESEAKTFLTSYIRSRDSVVKTAEQQWNKITKEYLVSDSTSHCTSEIGSMSRK